MLHAIMTGEAWWALGQVIMIDLVLAGDNAVVIGLAAAGLPKEQRNKAILVGIIAATVLRIAFASVTLQLLEILGLLLVGGILLLWVCWKMWRELKDGAEGAGSEDGGDVDPFDLVELPPGDADHPDQDDEQRQEQPVRDAVNAVDRQRLVVYAVEFRIVEARRRCGHAPDGENIPRGARRICAL